VILATKNNELATLVGLTFDAENSSFEKNNCLASFAIYSADKRDVASKFIK
jgi:hypothetical protein